jgi:hypothetical protein
MAARLAVSIAMGLAVVFMPELVLAARQTGTALAAAMRVILPAPIRRALASETAGIICILMLPRLIGAFVGFLAMLWMFRWLFGVPLSPFAEFNNFVAAFRATH